jgi:Carboxypeptidase regulatory-like domain/TonB dependent receptor-like, beta-barrel
VRAWVVIGLLNIFSACMCIGQSPNGIISGIVLDPAGSAIVGADVLIVSDTTGVQYAGRTNGEGIYVVPNVPPGPYRIQVSKSGFKTLIKPDVILNVQDALAINFTLPIGAISEVVTVQGGSPLVNTESGAVGTVIDKQFVQNLPLNGRSFNTLLQLTPGVVIAPIANGDAAGQFSVAGQRTDANYFTIDGVSANFGALSGFPPGATGLGQTPAFSAVGGTSSLVSVEALQEFRVETSSASPEFGRMPGGQVVLTTRSGTNEIHGGLYEYFRNDVLDANDWFANAAEKNRAPERHNDFGGFLGGPIVTGKTFYFLSYEGARLRLPQTTVIQVPSSAARQAASTAAAPYLESYPLPDPKGPISPNGETARFTGTYSNSATLNAGSVRIDHTFNSNLSIFGRYNEAPSQSVNRVGSLNQVNFTNVNTRTVTVGLNEVLGDHLFNALRANYSSQSSGESFTTDSFGGATPINIQLLLGSLSPAQNYGVFLTFDTGSYSSGKFSNNRAKQMNLVDDVGFTRGTHQMKAGVDYRAIFLHTSAYRDFSELLATSVGNFVNTNKAILITGSVSPSDLLAQSLSVYGQDTWKLTGRLTLIYGLRWELTPAASGRNGTTLAGWRDVGTPSDITLAPKGASLWDTKLTNFGPRIGAAYRLTQAGDLLLRAGAGIFYDLGFGDASRLAKSFPNFLTKTIPSVTVPLSDPANLLPPPATFGPPFSGTIYAFDPALGLPRSYQWNLSLEKSFGGSQAVSVTYVGQAGRDLLRQAALFRPNPNFAGEFVLTGNSARSNYNALQVQYRRPLKQGLQALLNYTFSHSLDNASNDTVAGFSGTVISAENDYASSDFDVRHSFSGALTYELPSPKVRNRVNAVLRDWLIATVVVARTGFPFNGVVFGTSPDPGGFVLTRPDAVAGEPRWIANPAAPGGKMVNSAAFTIPKTTRQGTEGRNDIAGFGLAQADLSLVRSFPIAERVTLQFRADAFNVLNHANFTNPSGAIQFAPLALESHQMLNQSLSGLNPLFQEGGPRSLQLSLKLSF